MSLESLVVGLMAGGTAMKATGQHEEAKQQENILKHRARLGEIDAAAQERETDVNIERARKRATAITESQIAEFAASGVLPTGAPLRVIAETVGELEKGVRDIGRRGFAEAEKMKHQARLDRIAAKIVKKKGHRQVFNTLLEGGTQIGMFGYEQGWFGGGGQTEIEPGIFEELDKDNRKTNSSSKKTSVYRSH